MLVLSRRRNESIIATLPDGRCITITVVDIRDCGKVRVGITADRDIVVHRAEVQARIEAEKQHA